MSTSFAFFSSSRFLSVHDWPVLVGTDDAVPAVPVSTRLVPDVDQYWVSAPAFRPETRGGGPPAHAPHRHATEPLAASVSDTSAVALERHVTPLPHAPYA